MEKEHMKTLVEDFFRKKVQKDSKIQNAHLLVHSDKLGIHLKIAEGSTAIADQPYYIASVSKLFASVLFSILVENGMCSFEDHISKYLDNEILRDLHVYKGKNYTSEIKVKHLLNNTSGLHDFVEDKPKQGKSMINMIVDDPSRRWTPMEVIQWAKENLETYFPPGEGFHYSDTGYHLLGLIIENITKITYPEALRYYIFEPLEMKNSHFSRTEPIENSEHPIADLYVHNTRINDHKSLSIMYAGGGVVSTTEDLLKFMKALVNYQIIKKDTIDKMKQDYGKFFLGIDYGYGVMNIKTIPILMPSKFNAWGNAGSTGSFLFYHPGTESYLIGSLNHFGYGQKGIRLMLQIANKLSKNLIKS